MPPDAQTFEKEAVDASGRHAVVMDGGLSGVTGSFLPGREERSRRVRSFGSMVPHVIYPVDLAVSELARFGDRDQYGIRALATRGLINPDNFAGRVEEAFRYCVGGLDPCPQQSQGCQEDCRRSATTPRSRRRPAAGDFGSLRVSNAMYRREPVMPSPASRESERTAIG